MVENYYDPNPEIPGSHTFLENGLKNQSEVIKRGKNIVLLGTAVDGPVLEPIPIYDYEDAETIFGPYYDKDTQSPNGASLTRHIKRLFDDKEHRPDNVTLMRVTGKRAEGEIPLYAQREEKLINENKVLGLALGNIETRFNLNIPDGVHTFDDVTYDESQIEVLLAEADGTPVRSDDLLIDKDNGIVILEEGASNSNATLILDYLLKHIKYVDMLQEIAQPTDGDREFQLNNQNLLASGLIVDLVHRDTDTVNTLGEDDYSINLGEGILNITATHFDPSVEDVVVSYTYLETVSENKEFMGKADGDNQYFYLDHIADSTQPVTVSVDGRELASEAFSVNYSTNGVTVINLKPGFVDKNKEVRSSYYWNSLVEIKNNIDVRSIFGGKLYNDVSIEIADNLTMRKNRYETAADLVEPAAMLAVPDTEYRFYFPNQERSIVEGSVSLLVSDGTTDTPLAETDYTLNAEQGTVVVDDLAFDPLTDTLLVSAYAYKEAVEELVTTVRGNYNAELNEFEGELLNRLDEARVELRHQYLVPDSLNIVVLRGEDELPATESVDYYVDYAKGEIVFEETSNLYPLSLQDKIKADSYQYYNVNSKAITIKKPDAKSRDTLKEFSFEIGGKVNSISELLTAINQNSNNNVIQTRIDEELFAVDAMQLVTPDLKLQDLTDISTLNKTVVRLRHGEDGINATKEELYKALEGEKDSNGNTIRVGAYDILKEYGQARYITPLGVYADDELSGGRSFAQQLANFTMRAFLGNNDVFGFIGTKPLQNPTQIEKINVVNKLENLDTSFFLQTEDGTSFVTDRKGQRIDAGRTIGIVQYDLRVYDEILGMPVIESGAVNAAGMASMLSRTNSLTNETIGLGELAYRLSSKQQARLLANKLMPAKMAYGESRVVDGLTCAQRGSGWETFQTVHIAYNVSAAINRIFDRYIGNGNSLAKRNALEDEIDNSLKNDPAIVNYDFELKMSAKDRQIGRMLVPLELVPIGEFRKIYTMISRNEAL